MDVIVASAQGIEPHADVGTAPSFRVLLRPSSFSTRDLGS